MLKRESVCVYCVVCSVVCCLFGVCACGESSSCRFGFRVMGGRCTCLSVSVCVCVCEVVNVSVTVCNCALPHACSIVSSHVSAFARSFNTPFHR